MVLVASSAEKTLDLGAGKTPASKRNGCPRFVNAPKGQLGFHLFQAHNILYMPMSRRTGIDENQTALLGGDKEMNKFSRHLETGVIMKLTEAQKARQRELALLDESRGVG